jgi:hypothetical protein
MASTVKHLRSSTANKRPTASGLADGQLGINTASGTPGIFFKNSAGAVTKVGPAHVGSTAPNVSPAGSAGNSLGELWVNNSTTINGLNYYTGSAFVNLTPSGTTTVAGLVELATDAETQTGTDTVRAVTPSGLQSKVSNSTSTTSSTTIASSTAVKAAYDLADAALPKAGGRITGNLEIGPVGSLSFEGSSDDSFETTIAVVNPTAARTITFPNVTGTVITTGDTGTVTSTMIANGAIVDADINASAEIAVSKLADGAARQLLQTDAAGTGVEWTNNVDIPGTLDVTGATVLDGDLTIPDKIIHAGDTNTAIRFPAADTIAFETDGSERARITSTGAVLVGATAAPTGVADGDIALQNRLVMNASAANYGQFQRIVDTGTNLTATTGTIVFKFKSATPTQNRAAYIKINLSGRANNATPSNSPTCEYAFQLHQTSAGVFTINGTTTIFEYTFVRATHFAFADLGSGECTVTLTNPVAAIITPAYMVEINAQLGGVGLDSVTTT